MADEQYTGWFIDWIEQWSQFRGGCNWYTFHPVKIEFEDDRILGGAELTVILLGLGFRVRYNYEVTEAVAGIQRGIAKIIGELPPKHREQVDARAAQLISEEQARRVMDTWCLECNRPAAWVRCTQFAGSHPFCDQHARLESDFGKDGGSSFFWREITEAEKETRNA